MSRRLSPKFKLYLGSEGTEEEWEYIPELQLFLSDSIHVVLNSAVGITPEAEDWAPEVGIMFSFYDPQHCICFSCLLP